MYAILITGAALVGLPIILHLIMKQEPKRLLFPAVRFLRQKQRTNQRKMRLRHFLLLLLRCLLIALFCATLIQPKIPSAGLVNLTGDAPVAAVLVIDTSPSMGYKADGKTRLDEARRRAFELLDGLPSGSRVAVVDPADPVGTWELSAGDARRKVESLQLRGGGPPVTTALATAYGLLKTVDQESEASEPLARLVVVFSDRADACWKADQSESLKKAAEQVPKPAVAHLFVDVGVEKPANVSITSAAVQPQLSRAGTAVTVAVTVQAAGPDVSPVVLCKVDDGAASERKDLGLLPAGTPKSVTFTLRDLPVGWHKAVVSLETPDALDADNTRTVAFRVGESRKVLTISDDPEDAAFWRLAHREMGDFACEVKTPAQATNFTGYEAVCLLSVSNPTEGGLWDRLAGYVKSGGKLLVIPGGELVNAAYTPDASGGLLPGKLARVVTLDSEATWVTDADARRRHRFLAPFEAWERAGNVDFVKKPPRVFRFWEVEGAPSEQVVVSYTAADAQMKRYPAVLERTFPSGGKVLLLTTRMDSPWPEFPERKNWNSYWETSEGSWPTVFPHLLMTYLAGDTAEASYNFTTGQAVLIPLPPGGGLKGKKLVFEGPGLSGKDAEIDVGENLTTIRLDPGRTLTPGYYAIKTDDRSWQEAFALNPPAEEWNLEKVPKEAIESLFGPDSVLTAERNLKLGEILAVKFDPELRLFPWLLIGVLLLFALEGLAANRFYRVRPGR